MKQAWRFIRQWWWAFVGIAGGIFLLVWRIIASKPGGGAVIDPPVPTPTLSERAKVEVERVRLEGEVEKAKVAATADAHREEIARIEETGKTDPKEARRQLAAHLARNL